MIRTGRSLAGTSRLLTSHGVPTAAQRVRRSGDNVLQADTPVPMTALQVPLIATFVSLTATFVSITSHSERAIIRTLSQSARPPPLVVRNQERAVATLSAADRSPSASATNAHGDQRAHRLSECDA